jgi:hypothetical protein
MRKPKVNVSATKLVTPEYPQGLTTGEAVSKRGAAYRWCATQSGAIVSLMREIPRGGRPLVRDDDPYTELAPLVRKAIERLAA